MTFSILDILKNAECPIQHYFHIYCPGCGGTRAAEALFRLHPVQSLYDNPAVVLLITAAVCIRAVNFLEAGGSEHKWYKIRIGINVSFLILWFVFFAVRNILLLYFGIDMLGDLSLAIVVV
jgi:hypothetical protein